MVGRPAKYTDPKDMGINIDDYFAQCDAAKDHYTVPGLALHLGFCSRQSFFDYIERDESKANNGFTDTIKKAKFRIEQQRNKMLLTGKHNPAGIIFDLKNNFNWQDKQIIEASYKDETIDPEALEMVRAMALEIARGQEPKQITAGDEETDAD